MQDGTRARAQAAAFTIERAVPAYRAVFHHILASTQAQRAIATDHRLQSRLEAQLS
jgi:hypothetical protein